MARRHWRFVVRDQYGFVIQNAKVNVYLPGTTTVFTGTAYDAASGGGAVTNPFTTNAYGEVEAWFDTAQVVDVQVDDNSNLAYRAVGGASATVDFSTFTEKDDIYVSASDQQVIDFGEDGDIVGITAGSQTTDAGVSTELAPADHVHGHVALMEADDLPIAHGATEHTNITRAFWLPVNDGVVADGGTLAVRGTPQNALRVITLADAASTGALWDFVVPADWAGGNFNVEIYHAGQTTTGGAVRWSVNFLDIQEGESVVGSAGAVDFTGATLATADLLVIEAAQSYAFTVTAGDLMRLAIRRLGTDGADTYAASTSLIGVRVSYTANQ